ncbi:MAG TPA: hypothetical protein VGK87_06945 [Anaerolineae bacterium]
MDFGGIINRAFKITWKYKILWILGFLAALGSGGSGGSFNFNFGSNSTFNPNTGQMPPWMQEIARHPEPLLAIAGVLACLFIIIGIVFGIIGIIARGGLIAGVQQIETESNTTFGSAWKSGASRFWPMLGLSLLVALPIILLVIVLIGAGAFAFGGIIAAAATSNRSGANNSAGLGGLLAAGISIFCCLLCVAVIYGLIAEALTTFGERYIMIEKLGVMASLSKAWSLFKANLGNIILMALLMGVISVVFGLITGAVALVVLAPTMLPVILELTRGGTPGTAAIVLAVIGFILAAIIGAVVRSLFIVFNSATWTLVYRQFTGNAPTVSSPPAIAAPPAVPAPPAA